MQPLIIWRAGNSFHDPEYCIWKVRLHGLVLTFLLRECVGAGLRYSPSENSPYFANYAAITGILGERLSQASELHVVESTHRLTFPQLQALVFRTILLSGDCFLIRCADGSVCLKESDYVYTPPFFTQINGIAKTDRGNAIIDGIELDTHSRPYCLLVLLRSQ